MGCRQLKLIKEDSHAASSRSSQTRSAARSEVRLGLVVQVHERDHGRRQEGGGRAHHLRGARPDREEVRQGSAGDLRCRAEQHQADGRGQVAPRRRCQLPGASGSAPGAAPGAGHALAEGVGAQARREVDGRALGQRTARGQ